MTTPQPDQRRRAGRNSDASVAMERFAVRPPRWLHVLFGRNPLIRMSDRLEALAVALTVAVALLAAPIAGAVGTAIYDSRTHLQAEQGQHRTAVAATVLNRPARSDATRVHARWFAAGTEHTGMVHASSAPKPGDVIEVAVNPDGSYAGPPGLPPARGAVLAAVAIWLTVTAAAVAVLAGVRGFLSRSRAAGWRPELVHEL